MSLLFSGECFLVAFELMNASLEFSTNVVKIILCFLDLAFTNVDALDLLHLSIEVFAVILIPSNILRRLIATLELIGKVVSRFTFLARISFKIGQKLTFLIYISKLEPHHIQLLLGFEVF